LLLLPKQNVGLFLSFITEDNRIREKVEDAFFDRYFPPSPHERPGSRTPKPVCSPLNTAAHTMDTAQSLGHRKDSEPVHAAQGRAARKWQSDVSGLGPDALQLEPIATDLYREVMHGRLEVSFRRDSSGNATHMFLSMLPFMPTERAPLHERGSFWFPLLGAAVLFFLGTLASNYYRWREVRAMPAAERHAVWVGSGAAAWAFATLAVIGGIVAATRLDGLFEHIPASLTVALVMPLIFVGLSAWLIVVTFNVWRSRFWTLGRRIGYTLTALASVIFCLFSGSGICWAGTTDDTVICCQLPCPSTAEGPFGELCRPLMPSRYFARAAT